MTSMRSGDHPGASPNAAQDALEHKGQATLDVKASLDLMLQAEGDASTVERLTPNGEVF